MTRIEHQQAARKRGNDARQLGARRLSQAVDAQRRLNTPPALATGPHQTSRVRATPSVAVLTQLQDWQGRCVLRALHFQVSRTHWDPDLHSLTRS
jgi:hypothetical protein